MRWEFHIVIVRGESSFELSLYSSWLVTGLITDVVSISTVMAYIFIVVQLLSDAMGKGRHNPVEPYVLHGIS